MSTTDPPAPSRDQIFPNVLGVDAAGNVIANLQGVSLPAATSFVAASSLNRVQWIDASNGAKVAEVISTPNDVQLNSYSQGGNQAFTDIQAIDNVSFGADVRCSSNGGGQLASVSVSAAASGGPGAQRTLIYADGRSDYVTQDVFGGVVYGRPVKVIRSGQYNLVAGWQQIAFNAYSLDGNDPQGMWNGAQLSWRAPATGFYRLHLCVGITNGTGATIEFAMGENAIFSYGIDYPLTTNSSVISAHRDYFLGVNALVTPGCYVSSVAGFGVSLIQAESTFQRIA